MRAAHTPQCLRVSIHFYLKFHIIMAQTQIRFGAIEERIKIEMSTRTEKNALWNKQTVISANHNDNISFQYPNNLYGFFFLLLWYHRCIFGEHVFWGRRNDDFRVILLIIPFPYDSRDFSLLDFSSIKCAPNVILLHIQSFIQRWVRRA